MTGSSRSSDGTYVLKLKLGPRALLRADSKLKFGAPLGDAVTSAVVALALVPLLDSGNVPATARNSPAARSCRPCMDHPLKCVCVCIPDCARIGARTASENTGLFWSRETAIWSADVGEMRREGVTSSAAAVAPLLFVPLKEAAEAAAAAAASAAVVSVAAAARASTPSRTSFANVTTVAFGLLLPPLSTGRGFLTGAAVEPVSSASANGGRRRDPQSVDRAVCNASAERDVHVKGTKRQCT